MALYEKKNILRGMYTRPDPDAVAAGDGTGVGSESVGVNGAGARGAGKAKPPLDLRIEKWLKPVLRVAAFIPLLLGLLAIAWPLVSHYVEGYTFQEDPGGNKYLSEAFISIGAVVFVILLGLLGFFGLRESMGPKLRWSLFALTLGLVPLAIVGMFFGPVMRSMGVEAGYKAINGEKLVADAGEISRLLPAMYDGVRTITPLDSDWALLPAYVREKVRPLRVNVYAKGVTFDLEVDSYGYYAMGTGPSTPRSGLMVVVHRPGELPWMTGDLDRFAARNNYERARWLDGSEDPEGVKGVPTTAAASGPVAMGGGVRAVLRFKNRQDEFMELKDAPDPSGVGPGSGPGGTGAGGGGATVPGGGLPGGEVPAGALPEGAVTGGGTGGEAKVKKCSCEG